MKGISRTAASRQLAALDLGSNSFHLLVARCEGDVCRPQLRLGEKVQLAAGMRDGMLQPEAIARGLDCLRRFLPHIRSLESGAVRVVATQALRVARNPRDFLTPAEQLLRRPIEVISGEDEARLIYRAVAGYGTRGPCLVVDIGGGSTELVRGCAGHVERLCSIPVGCVNFLDHFPGGLISVEHWHRARRAAGQALSAWGEGAAGVQVVGCSGTLLAVAEVLRCQGWGDGTIDVGGLRRLETALLRFERLQSVCFPGLCESRRSVFASGLAIVYGLFDALGIERLSLAPVALREGVVAELAGSATALTEQCSA